MVLAFAEFTLDLPRRELRRGTAIVPLQPKAFDLLVYLVRHRDRVVSKDELLRELWPEEVVTEWALTFSVKLVRQALNDRAGKNALVRTVHRRGFRFMGEACEPAAESSPAPTQAEAGDACTPASSTQWMSVLGRDRSTAFCGRIDELRHLTSALEGALTGELTAALICGEAGIGKTRLASELAQLAAARNVLVLAGRCDEGAPPVFWPWVQIVRAYLAAHRPEQFLNVLGGGAGDIARLVTALQPHVPAAALEQVPDSEHLRLRLLDSMTGFLNTAAQRQPLLLVLDDLQWADNSSLSVLRSLLEYTADVPLMVLATLRDTEVESDSALGRLLLLLRRERRCADIHLGGLSRSEARLLLGGDPQAPAQPWLDAMYDSSDGNPFFLEELWRDSNERGAGADVGGRHTLSVPNVVREVVLQRIDRLTPATRELLALAAVIGREFDLTIVQRAAGVTEAAAMDCIEEALRAHVLAETPDRDRLRFVHAIVNEAMYSRLSGPRRLDGHRRVAQALQATRADSPDDLPELAYHFFRALGGHRSGPLFDQALSYARLAGAEATRRLSYSEAAAFQERAVDLLESAPQGDDAVLADTLIDLGWSHYRSDEPELSRRVFLRAAEVARRAGLSDRLARAAIGIGRGPQGIGASETETIGLMEEALRCLPADAVALRAMCMARLNYALCTVPGTLARRTGLGDEAIALARRLDDPETLLWVLQYNRWSWWGPQTQEGKRAALEELAALAQRVRGSEHELAVYLLYVTDLLEIGDMEAADAAMERSAALTAQWRLPWYRWFLLRFHTLRAQQEGRFADSEAFAEQALAAGQRMKHPYAPHFYVAQICMLRVHRGEHAEVEPVVEAFMSSPRALPAWRAILAYLYGESGKPDLMRREFETMAADNFSSLPQDSIWLNGVGYLAEVCHALDDRERAAVLYDLLSPHAQRIIGMAAGIFSLGHASRYLGLLAATLGRHDTAQQHFETAIAMHQRLGARPWIAASQYDCARWHLSQNRREAAAPLLDAATEIATALELKGLLTKIRRLRRSSPRALTRR